MVDANSQAACDFADERLEDRWSPAQSFLFVVAASIGLWRLIGLALTSVL